GFVGTGFAGHCREAAQFPVCWPIGAVGNIRRETACPTSDARKLPTSDNGIDQTSGITGNVLAPAEWQFCNPVNVDLMSGIEVGDGTVLIRVPGVDDLASQTAGCALDSLSIGSEINGL